MDVKKIRKNLKKKLKYNARQVSVSQKHSTIVFTVRNENVDYAKLKDFSETFENISRDEATGCILRGGNTFTRVDYSDQVKETLTAKYLESVEKAISKIEGSCLQDIEDTNFMVGKSLNGFSIWVKKDNCGSHLTEAYSPKEIAFTIALKG